MAIFAKQKEVEPYTLLAAISLRSNGNAGETNRTRDAWRVEALRDSRAGLGTPLATERERSGVKDCAICKAIWIPSEVL
jgi:hypothetical protein